MDWVWAIRMQSTANWVKKIIIILWKSYILEYWQLFKFLCPMNLLQLFGWLSLSSKHIWESSQNIDYNEYLMKREINRISVVCESISMPLPGQIEQKRYMLNEMKRLLYCTILTLFKYILSYVTV